jgi:hypothetical protein
MTTKLLPSVRLSDALRALGLGPVRGYSANEAEIKATGNKCGVMVDCDPRENNFNAVLLNDWDDDLCMYMSSSDMYNDSITSESWDVVANWIKRHFSS